MNRGITGVKSGRYDLQEAAWSQERLIIRLGTQEAFMSILHTYILQAPARYYPMLLDTKSSTLMRDARDQTTNSRTIDRYGPKPVWKQELALDAVYTCKIGWSRVNRLPGAHCSPAISSAGTLSPRPPFPRRTPSSP